MMALSTLCFSGCDGFVLVPRPAAAAAALQRQRQRQRLHTPNASNAAAAIRTSGSAAPATNMMSTPTPPPPPRRQNTPQEEVTFEELSRNQSVQGEKYNFHDAKWNIMFEKLQEYKTVHGHCLVPWNYKCDDGTRLGRWVLKHRRAPRYTREDWKRRGEQRRQALDSIGFVWIVNERGRQLTPETGQYASAAERFNARWNARFEQLMEYKKVHGNCLVPKKYECADGAKLGAWVSAQRCVGISDSETNLMRRQTLDAIGFVWQVRAPTYTLDERWNGMFQLLQKYQATHGDCLVPKDYVTEDKKPLGTWVGVQRQALTSGKMFRDIYKDRLQKLQSIGFVLRALPDDSLILQWDRNFEQLVEYQRQHGNCLVPNEYAGDLALGQWVSDQRKHRHTMDTKRIQQLDAIGFVWDAHEAKWNAKFHELQRFQRQHGHCLVSRYQPDAEYPGLGEWVYKQRYFRRTMDTKRIQQLDSNGFVWDALEETSS
jgi:Helicase associated domain